MARKKITEYLTGKERPVYIGGYIPESLREKALKIMEANNLIHGDVIRAAYRMLVEDSAGEIVKIAQGESKYVKKT